MELMGALEGLRAIEGARRIAVYSDSAYLVNCFLERWWQRWERTGWRNRGGAPVANRDLWEALLAETRRHEVTWHKVRGHAGDELNERADVVARAAIARARS
jgi:ribonuclease HI